MTSPVPHPSCFHSQGSRILPGAEYLGRRCDCPLGVSLHITTYQAFSSHQRCIKMVKLPRFSAFFLRTHWGVGAYSLVPRGSPGARRSPCSLSFFPDHVLTVLLLLIGFYLPLLILSQLAWPTNVRLTL